MKKNLNGKVSGLEKRRAWTGVLCCSPFIIGFRLFMIKPMFQSFMMTFCEVQVGAGKFDLVFTGLTNLNTAFRVDPDFSRFLLEGFARMIVYSLAIMVFSFFVALVLNQEFHGRALVRAIFFLPVILSSGVILGLETNNSVIAMIQADISDSMQGVSITVVLEDILKTAGVGVRAYEQVFTLIDNIYEASGNGYTFILRMYSPRILPDTYFYYLPKGINVDFTSNPKKVSKPNFNNAEEAIKFVNDSQEALLKERDFISNIMDMIKDENYDRVTISNELKKVRKLSDDLQYGLSELAENTIDEDFYLGSKLQFQSGDMAFLKSKLVDSEGCLSKINADMNSNSDFYSKRLKKNLDAIQDYFSKLEENAQTFDGYTDEIKIKAQKQFSKSADDALSEARNIGAGELQQKSTIYLEHLRNERQKNIDGIVSSYNEVTEQTMDMLNKASENPELGDAVSSAMKALDEFDKLEKQNEQLSREKKKKKAENAAKKKSKYVSKK